MKISSCTEAEDRLLHMKRRQQENRRRQNIRLLSPREPTPLTTARLGWTIIFLLSSSYTAGTWEKPFNGLSNRGRASFLVVLLPEIHSLKVCRSELLSLTWRNEVRKADRGHLDEEESQPRWRRQTVERPRCREIAALTWKCHRDLCVHRHLTFKTAI